MTSHKPNPWEGEALLARLQNDHVHKFVVRTEDKLREHFAGEIAAARARGLAPVFNFEPGDDDLVEPAPAPRRGAPKPHRIRTPSLTKALREAKKAGIPVTGATFTADSVSLSFGEAAKSNGNDLDQWLAGRHESPIKGH